MRAWSSGVSCGIEALGLERRVAGRLAAERIEAAARWPCIRCALTSAIAAATAPRGRSSGSADVGAAPPARDAGRGRRRSRRSTTPSRSRSGSCS